jgi:hypothetical protein
MMYVMMFVMMYAMMCVMMFEAAAVTEEEVNATSLWRWW